MQAWRKRCHSVHFLCLIRDLGRILNMLREGCWSEVHRAVKQWNHCRSLTEFNVHGGCWTCRTPGWKLLQSVHGQNCRNCKGPVCCAPGHFHHLGLVDPMLEGKKLFDGSFHSRISELPLRKSVFHLYGAMQLPILTLIVTLEQFQLFKNGTLETDASWHRSYCKKTKPKLGLIKTNLYWLLIPVSIQHFFTPWVSLLQPVLNQVNLKKKGWKPTFLGRIFFVLIKDIFFLHIR